MVALRGRVLGRGVGAPGVQGLDDQSGTQWG
jgi:hypothetical protein